MTIKYRPKGSMICDPRSEEAKALIGKKVFYADNYPEILEKEPTILDSIRTPDETAYYPFRLQGSSDPNCCYKMIQEAEEVVEYKPKYRPYEDTAEMIADFKERFPSIKCEEFELPRIWIKNEETRAVFLIVALLQVCVNTTWGTLKPENLFNGYTYLDGSPCGKLVENENKEDV